MPKEQVHIRGAVAYRPGESARDVQIETPHYIENCNLITTAAGTFQGLPGLRSIPANKRNYQSCGTVAPLQRKKAYVLTSATGSRSANVDAVIFNSNSGFESKLDFVSLDRNQMLAPIPYTAASDGENVYIANPWPDTQKSAPNRPQRVGKIPFGQFDGAKPAAEEISEVYLPLPDPAAAQIEIRMDRDKYAVDAYGVSDDDKLFQTVGDPNPSNPNTDPSPQRFVIPKGDAAEPAFEEDIRYFYKISYIYDGYQESPLVDLPFEQGVEYLEPATDRKEAWDAWNEARIGRQVSYTAELPLYPLTLREDRNWIFGGGLETLPLTIRIGNPAGIPARVFAINIYRQAAVESGSLVPQEDGYRLFESLRIDDEATGWTDRETTPNRAIPDKGDQGQLYSDRTHLPESIEHMDVRYRLCAEVRGRLFVAQVWLPEGGFQGNLILRSAYQRFSMFDYVNEGVRTKQVVTAMAFYGGYLYAFETGHTYRIDPDSMVIIDEYEGIGAAGPEAVAVTDGGLFVASHENIWVATHQQGFVAIGNEVNDIEEQGDADVAEGFPQIQLAGFSKHDRREKVVAVYDSRFDTVFFFFVVSSEVRGWAWHVSGRRWSTAVNLGTRLLRGGFTDHEGRAYLFGKNGISRLFDDEANPLLWRFMSSQIHAGQIRFTPYEVGVTLVNDDYTDDQVEAMLDKVKLRVGFNGRDFRLRDRTDIYPGSTIGRYGVGRHQDPLAPDEVLDVNDPRATGIPTWRRVYSLQVDIRATDAVKVSDINMIIRRFIPRSRTPDTSG